MISRCKDRDYLINFQTIRQKSDKKPKPTTIRKAPQSGSLELLMFHIESAHAALNFYILNYVLLLIDVATCRKKVSNREIFMA